jgi:hypothetical protein
MHSAPAWAGKPLYITWEEAVESARVEEEIQ